MIPKELDFRFATMLALAFKGTHTCYRVWTSSISREVTKSPPNGFNLENSFLAKVTAVDSDVVVECLHHAESVRGLRL